MNGACAFGADSTLVSVEIGVEGLYPLPDPHVIAEGNSIHLRAAPLWRDPCSEDTWSGSGESGTWRSSDPALATVYPNGIVHTHAAGLATITATIAAVNATLDLQVVALGTVPPMAALVTGGGLSCGLTADGTLYCWGDGIPNLCVHGGNGAECGSNYTTGPLTTPEYARSWATCSAAPPNTWSEPGVYSSDSPCSRVPSRYTLGVDLSAIDAGGGSHSSSFDSDVCGYTELGALYCAGKVGPLEAPGGGTVYTAVSVGSDHACALDRYGTAHCWGGNDYGQLGDSTRNSREGLQPVYGNRQFSVLGAADHFACGLATDGRAYCWGASVTGQAGSPGSLDHCPVGFLGIACSLIPRLVSDTVFQQLSVGGTNLSDTHICGLTADGTAYCWGGNYEGSLGDGTTEWTSEPKPVGGGVRFRSISAGGSHTCGLALDGSAYCWGSNMSGQLGHPGIAASSLPVPVTSGATFTAISAGGSHTCGLTAEGIVYCWGYNGWGQLGNGTLEDSDTPTRIAGQGEG